MNGRFCGVGDPAHHQFDLALCHLTPARARRGGAGADGASTTKAAKAGAAIASTGTASFPAASFLRQGRRPASASPHAAAPHLPPSPPVPGSRPQYAPARPRCADAGLCDPHDLDANRVAFSRAVQTAVHFDAPCSTHMKIGLARSALRRQGGRESAYRRRAAFAYSERDRRCHQGELGRCRRHLDFRPPRCPGYYVADRTARKARRDRLRQRTELTSNAILTFATERKIEWHYIAPGKPMQNGFVESFNGPLGF